MTKLGRISSENCDHTEGLDQRGQEMHPPSVPANHEHSTHDVAALLGRTRELVLWLDQLSDALRATAESWRWRVGDRVIRVVERVLGRPRHQELAMDHAVRVLGNIEVWKAEFSQLAAYVQHRSIEVAPSEFVPISIAPRFCRGSHYDLIVLSNVGWDTRYQRPQQIASQFARRGYRVFYVAAYRFLPPDSPNAFELRAVADNVVEVTLRAGRALDCYGSVVDSSTMPPLLDSLRELRREHGVVDGIVHVHLAFWTELALAARDAFDWAVVYDCMDEWEDFPGIGRDLLVAEERLVRESDLVVVTAALLKQKWAPVARQCVLVRNAVDFDFFHDRYRPNSLLSLPHPVVGFYGAIAEWVDVQLIAAVARRRPDWQFVLLGDIFIDDLAGLDRLSNVHLMGRRPYEEMPQFLYHFDVCMIPFRLNQITHAVDPVKLYEYVSSGKPVVAVPLAELEIYRDHLYFAEGADAFVAQIDVALSESDPELRRRRTELARANDWANRYHLIDEATVAGQGRLSIIVVTYKNPDLTRLCIESVLANTTHADYEVIVVDNASGDETANYLRYLEERHPQIKLILNSENLGFAAANNQGLRIATGDYLLLLNNDTIVPPSWTKPLLRPLADPGIGLVGPRTNSVGNEAKIAVPYAHLGGINRFALSLMTGCDGQQFDIHMLAMYCVAMRRDVFDEVGYLDEGFGIGMFEDDDYSYRVKAAGYRVVCAKDAFVHHFGQSAFKALLETGEYHRIWGQNQAYFESKWGQWKPHRHSA